MKLLWLIQIWWLAVMPAFRGAGAHRIEGKWLLTSYTYQGRTHAPYQLLELTKDGRMLYRGFVMARFVDRKGDLVLQSDVDEAFNGKGRIRWQGNDRMVWILPGMEMHFRRWTPRMDADEFHGVWLSAEDVLAYFKMEPGNRLTEVIFTADGTQTTVSDWYYLPGDDVLIFGPHTDILRGAYRITERFDDGISLQADTTEYFLFKDTMTAPAPSLHFEAEDLPAESPADELPWQGVAPADYPLGRDYYYRGYREVPEMDRVWIYDVTVAIRQNREQGTVCFTSYTQVFAGEEAEERTRCRGYVQESHNPFFPEPEPDRYRVVARNEQLEVPLGDFCCTVVEAVDGDTKLKYWMVNARPGVYAKIIREYPGPTNDTLVDIRILEDRDHEE